MPSKSKNSKAKKPSMPVSSMPFHVRFDIHIDVAEARRRFLNRVNNLVFDAFLETDLDPEIYHIVHWRIAMDLGEEFSEHADLKDYAENKFLKSLEVIEIAYTVLQEENTEKAEQLDGLIQGILDEGEDELGISWQDGAFIRTGARLLDVELINTSLDWLSKPKFKNVYEPFSKGLRHFLDSEKRPELLYDVITDMYESIEALSKIVTGRPRRDLSANAELFIKQVNASQHYKVLLKDYIVYANDFRHALEENKVRPKLTPHEAESFIYLTGLFIRLALNYTTLNSSQSEA